MTKPEIEKRIEELERKIRELEARPVVHQHFHAPPNAPNWPYILTQQPINPPWIVTCAAPNAAAGAPPLTSYFMTIND